jgi:NAD+ diphosphatase
MALDRVTTERKDPATVERLLERTDATAVAAGHDGVLISDGDSPGLARTGADAEQDPILLGLENGGHPVFALDLDALSAPDRERLLDGRRLISLRDAGVTLPHAEAGLAAYVTALLNWHRRHRFCANCGAKTAIEEGGYSRHCPRCGATHFPRTDPVVIVTVEHDGRLLLGRRAGWPDARYSVLAGFVSPGESAEEAVVREVCEESGILARDPVYISSQPWPFPSSLMLGFHAESDGGEPKARDGELEEVDWFSLDEVQRAARGEDPEIRLPPPVSIARFLIDRWVERQEA